MTTPGIQAAAGWYADPTGAPQLRYFDGQAWTTHVQPAPQFAPQPGYPGAQVAPYQGVPYQRAPYQGAPYQGVPYQGAPYQGVPYQGMPHQDVGPGSALHYLVPIGRSWQAVVAPWIGIFGLLLWILGPVAIGVGGWALVRARHGGHGTGRAIVALVLGTLGTTMMFAFIGDVMT